ncbi:MAG: hypothetical protein QF741_02300 [Candidatus Peribacteraceae bacterium]|jgi:hypothetical protein|nr:hypothetical protein [Candidatus Peribacteraceae bacterium]MDP7454488.1 hypothetical protein [Candidatus Peribacteraceae bacterium]
MKKLILTGSLCIAVIAVAKFGYIIDYRLSDANSVVVLRVQAGPSRDTLQSLRKKVEAAKREKRRLWSMYKSTKIKEKERYETAKKVSFDKYNKAKATILSKYKDAKAKAKSDYDTRRKKEWKMYKGRKKVAWDKYQNAKKNYTEKKESYKKCKVHNTEFDCRALRTEYKEARRKRKDYKYHYNATKDPNDPNSYRARYDRVKAKFKSNYEKKLKKGAIL